MGRQFNGWTSLLPAVCHVGYRDCRGLVAWVLYQDPCFEPIGGTALCQVPLVSGRGDARRVMPAVSVVPVDAALRDDRSICRYHGRDAPVVGEGVGNINCLS